MLLAYVLRIRVLYNVSTISEMSSREEVPEIRPHQRRLRARKSLYISLARLVVYIKALSSKPVLSRYCPCTNERVRLELFSVVKYTKNTTCLVLLDRAENLCTILSGQCACANYASANNSRLDEQGTLSSSTTYLNLVLQVSDGVIGRSERARG